MTLFYDDDDEHNFNVHRMKKEAVSVKEVDINK